jgi:hypothetical protein
MRRVKRSREVPFFACRLSTSLHMCQTADMDADRCERDDAIDASLLDCFLELGVKERIKSAANFANAVERLRRIRSADDSEQPA